MKTSLLATFLSGALFALASCGSGSGSGTGSRPITSFGTITGFGSVFVNGVRFSTSGATIVLDDNPASEGDLRIGMVVTVSGSRSGSSGSAARIEVDEAVKGFVESIAADGNRWAVMGQTVLIVDGQTQFENNPRPGVNDFVEVHGLVSGDGEITAGFIEKKNGPIFPAFEVKGFVKNHDNVAKTFQIGALTVDYNGANTNDMPATTLWNDLLVEAKGSTCAGPVPVCGTLTATKVEPNGPQMQDAGEVEIEGFVTAVPPAVPSGSFKVGNQLVVTNSSTRFEGGVLEDIAVGVKLEVEGVLSGGILTATEIEFEDSIKLESDIAAGSINLGANSFTLSGLPGITVTVNSLTEFEEGISGLNGLADGDHVRIRGRVSSGNNVIATEVEKRSAATRVVLQGAIQSIAGISPNQIVTILGVAVDTTAIVFEDVNDNVIDRAAFFAQAMVGTLVKARGSLGGGGTVTWSEMELED